MTERAPALRSSARQARARWRWPTEAITREGGLSLPARYFLAPTPALKNSVRGPSECEAAEGGCVAPRASSKSEARGPAEPRLAARRNAVSLVRHRDSRRAFFGPLKARKRRAETPAAERSEAEPVRA